MDGPLSPTPDGETAPQQVPAKTYRPGQFLPGVRDPRMGDQRAAGLAARDKYGVRERITHKAIAAVFREAWPPEEMARWLRAVAAGVDPDRLADKDGHVSQVPIDWTIRFRAAKLYMERALGMPAQHITVDAEMRASVAVAAVSATPEAWRTLPADELDSFRSTARKMLERSVQSAVQSRPQGVGMQGVTPPVIDAASIEKP